MKAAQIDFPMSVRLIETEKPKIKSDELLVRVKKVGICGTDLKLYDGSISYLKVGLLKLPHIPGHEWVGEIVETGNKSSSFHPGDRITGECHIGCGACEACDNGRQNICANRLRFGVLQNGAMSEYIVIPEKAAHKIPENISDEEAALVEPLTIALYALDRLEKITGSVLLITGLGPIGLLVSEVAKSMGAACIIGADINQHALQLGKKMGCDMVVDSSKENLQDQVNALTGGKGPEVIVEATGIHTMFQEILHMVRQGGQISLIGLANKKTELDTNLITTKDVRIYGNMASARVWDRAIRLISSKKIEVSKLITHQYPLNEVNCAFEKAYEKKDNVSKVIIDI